MTDPNTFDPESNKSDVEEVEDFEGQQPPKKRRRPAGTFNDPSEDIMQVSADEHDGDEEVDDL